MPDTTLTETDLAFIRASARGDTGRLMLATLLKTRQDLGYFPALDEVHADIVGASGGRSLDWQPESGPMRRAGPSRCIATRRRFGCYLSRHALWRRS